MLPRCFIISVIAVACCVAAARIAESDNLKPSIDEVRELLHVNGAEDVGGQVGPVAAVAGGSS